VLKLTFVMNAFSIQHIIHHIFLAGMKTC